MHDNGTRLAQCQECQKYDDNEERGWVKWMEHFVFKNGVTIRLKKVLTTSVNEIV